MNEKYDKYLCSHTLPEAVKCPYYIITEQMCALTGIFECYYDRKMKEENGNKNSTL